MEYVLTVIAGPEMALKHVGRSFKFILLHVCDHFIPHHRNNYHPHILGHRALALFSGLLLTVKIFTLSLLALGPATAVFSSAITPENILKLTNASRTQYRLSELSQHQLLAKAAQAKADDMLERGYFSHNTPDGRTPWSFINASGYNYMVAGENLAVNFTEAENVEDAWMNSPGHKANILNKNFEEIGIGISQGQYQGHAAIFVVQMFGTSAEQKIAISNVPTKIQTSDAQALQAEKQPEPDSKPAPAISKPKAQAKKITPTPAASQPVENLKDNEEPSGQWAKTLKPVQIVNTKAEFKEGFLELTVETNETAINVVAFYGNQAVMLSPKNNTHWLARLNLSETAKSNKAVQVVAEDMADNKAVTAVAEFSSSIGSNYNVLGAESPVKASMLGKNINLKTAEDKFYLLFLAGLLSSLILAIAIKRHIQHLSLVANTSFVAVLAVLLMTWG